MSRLILASRSPRRSELLHRMGLSFDTDAPDVDEHCDLPASEAVRLISFRKASASSHKYPGCFILAADTLISFNGSSIGKPRNAEDAFRILRMLSGRTHQVFSGVTVISPSGQAFTGGNCTSVSFSRISDREIESYIKTGEPMDKAGAYALQGMAGMWVEHIDGSDTSVIGLPLYLVRSLLDEAGYPLLDELGRQQTCYRG